MILKRRKVRCTYLEYLAHSYTISGAVFGALIRG